MGSFATNHPGKRSFQFLPRVIGDVLNARHLLTMKLRSEPKKNCPFPPKGDALIRAHHLNSYSRSVPTYDEKRTRSSLKALTTYWENRAAVIDIVRSKLH